MVILVALLVGWTSVARAENRRKIVMFLDDTPLSQQLGIVNLTGLLIGSKIEVIHVLSLINALAIELPLGGILLDALDFLLHHPDVLDVFDDLIGFADGITAVPADQVSQEEDIYDWGLDRIGVPYIHEDPELRGTGVKVAILDSGIVGHPDLQENIAGGYNAMRGGKNKPYLDGYGHGTHIAGIIAAAENGQGIVGVAPQARIMAVKVLDDNGFGYLSDVINGLQWADKEGIKLINISLGFFEDSEPLEQATRHLRYNRGVIMVASAGNKGCPPGQDEGAGSDGQDEAPACDSSQLGVKYPARYPWVIAVTATDFYDHVPDYCRLGLEVDVAAPGGAQANEQILSTYYRDGLYGLGSGTSQAAAYVTGAVTLVLKLNPGLPFDEILDLLKETASLEVWPGVGLINVQNLVEALQ
jgi:subtilisin family serine protease